MSWKLQGCAIGTTATELANWLTNQLSNEKSVIEKEKKVVVKIEEGSIRRIGMREFKWKHKHVAYFFFMNTFRKCFYFFCKL